jgi:hypothetical protein
VNAQCRANGVCVDNGLADEGTFCAPRCAGAQDCSPDYECGAVNGAEGTYCLPESLTCIDRCANVRCEEGVTCSPQTGECINACQTQGDCPGNNHCNYQLGCQPSGRGNIASGAACESDAQCAQGLVCGNGLAGQVCSRPCDSEMDCPAGGIFPAFCAPDSMGGRNVCLAFGI